MAPSKTVLLLISLTAAVVISRVAPSYLFRSSVWQTAFVFFFAEFLGLAVWSIVVYPTYFSPLRHLPTPPGASFYNGHWAAIRRDPSGEPQREWARTVPNNGLIRYMTFLNIERVMVTSPKGFAEVMNTKSYDFIKPPQIAKSIGRILGIGVLFAEGEEHKRQRKHLTPAFSYRHVKDLYPIFWSKACEMVRTMDTATTTTDPTTEKPNDSLVFAQFASRATLDIIGVAGFDQDFKALEDPDNELYKTYNSIFTPSKAARTLGLLSLVFPFWLIRNLPVKRNSDVQAASSFIRQTCLSMIQQKKTKLAAGKAAGIDILSVALASGGFTDDELVHQLMTFLAAGHETTSGALNWAMYLLCRHPTLQTRLRTELRNAKLPNPLDASSSATVTADFLDRIPYLSAFCNEVLRFIPPVPFTMRVADRATTIVGEPIPKGTIVIMCPQATNHSHELWGPDADDFNPDRWIDAATGLANNTGGSSSNYALLTFLHGPRGCIGQGFAKAEFACLLAACVAAFEYRLEDEGYVPEITGAITVRPKVPFRVKLTRVEY